MEMYEYMIFSTKKKKKTLAAHLCSLFRNVYQFYLSSFKKGFEMPINFFARVLQSHLRAHNANTGNTITSRDYSVYRIENLVTMFVLRKPN